MTILLQAVTWSEWFLSLAAEIQRNVWASIDGLITSIFGRLPFLLAGTIVLLLFWFLSHMVKKAFLAGTRRTRLDNRLRILFSRLIVVIMVVIGIFTSLTVIVPSFEFGSLIAGLGFTSFVVGFAAKDIVNNFISGVLILWQRPFHIGDHLFVGSNQGKVEYIGVRATSLRKDDGELILIPNGDMYSSALTIRSAGAKRRMNLNFCIGYDADIGRAKELISEELPGCPGVVAEPKPRIVVTDLTSDGVNLSVYFWIDTNESRPMEVFDGAATAIKESLSNEAIELFPPGSIIVQNAESGPQEEGTTRAAKQ